MDSITKNIQLVSSLLRSYWPSTPEYPLPVADDFRLWIGRRPRGMVLPAFFIVTNMDSVAQNIQLVSSLLHSYWPSIFKCRCLQKHRLSYNILQFTFQYGNDINSTSLLSSKYFKEHPIPSQLVLVSNCLKYSTILPSHSSFHFFCILLTSNCLMNCRRKYIHKTKTIFCPIEMYTESSKCAQL